MLATLNSRQIVDEIVKDTVKDNDPHDAVQISPEIVLASRQGTAAPALAPEIAPRPEPRFAPNPARAPGPTINVVYGKTAAAAPPVDTAVRITASDVPSQPKRSAAGKWLRGAFVAFLFAGASVAASIAWEQHGDAAKKVLAEWTPAAAAWMHALMPSASQTAPVAALEAAPPPPQAAEQAVAPAAPPLPAQAAVTPAATPPDPAQTVQSMTNDLAAMSQQIEQLKANIAELKAGQEQMAREMAKATAPKPVAAETRPVDPRARASALPPQPAAAPVRKPKPPVTRTYMPASSPAPFAPPPSQAAAVPPSAAPVTTTQAVADDDGPIVRPPMPLR